MVENKKFFQDKDFKGIVKVLEDLIKIKEKEDKHQAITLLQLIIKVQRKLKYKTERF